MSNEKTEETQIDTEIVKHVWKWTLSTGTKQVKRSGIYIFDCTEHWDLSLVDDRFHF